MKKIRVSISPKKLAEYTVFFGAVQKLKELSSLIRRIQNRKFSVVVEIGTLKGGTFWLWCQLAQPDALLMSIDLPGGPFAGDFTHPETTREKLISYGKAGQNIVIIRGDSHALETQEKVKEVLGNKKIDQLEDNLKKMKH